MDGRRNRKKVELSSRFWSKVDKERSAPCWVWTASRNRGYGQIGVNRQPRLAHRVAWELTHGPIPSGAEVWQRCRKRECVRPEHLTLIATDMDRFLFNVEKRGDGCWLWRGFIDDSGYGRFHFVCSDGRIEQHAHRASFMLFRCEIPEGLLIRHMCDVSCCVNPDHLLPGTNADNGKDKVRLSVSPSDEDRRRRHEAFLLGCRYGASTLTRPSYVEDVEAFELGYLRGVKALKEAQRDSPFTLIEEVA